MAGMYVNLVGFSLTKLTCCPIYKALALSPER